MYTSQNELLSREKDNPEKPFVKLHLKDGDVVIFEQHWQFDSVQSRIIGYGQRYDFNRKVIATKRISIPLDSISLYETNKPIIDSETGRIIAISIMTGINVAIGVLCLTDPKACFGSCPTFYMNEHDYFHHSDAEGFTNAILPSMEYADIDALNNKPLNSSEFKLTMKNEAQETHCVNEVAILAAPRNKGEKIYHNHRNKFYLSDEIIPLYKAVSNEGDITNSLFLADQQERFSLTDEKNLNSKEEIVLEFNHAKALSDAGLILHFRQSLLTTYLFYNAMSLMGNEVSDVFNKLETSTRAKKKFDATTKILAGIDAYVWDENKQKWVFQDAFNETGPIAINKQFINIKLSKPQKKFKIKLILNKGLWRLDYAAMSNVIKELSPQKILPYKIERNGKESPEALDKINDPKKHLINLPGNTVQLYYKMPEQNQDYELFLYSKGYYLEWMRSDWVKDKDISKLKQMILQPRKFLKQEAKNYKKYEKEMEEIFWNSKIEQQLISGEK
ncbi:MAG TPA: hypothetical protein PK006_03955 [Saprospiraceae bacterium]|nr:hypothetical protein [Saprospiraceae bacterium]